MTWATSDDLVALIDTPDDWEEDAELMATYAGRKDVDALFLRSTSDEGLPAMSIYRLARWDDARIEAHVSNFMAEGPDERKHQSVQEGTIGGAAATIMTSVAISQKYGNKRVVKAFAQLEDRHTWMITCYAAESDAGQHADCDAALGSVRIAPPSFVRNLTTPTPTSAERAARAELTANYVEAGERLSGERSPDITWSDGSNWHDGISHQLPELPLPLRVAPQEGLTCAQWEALNMAVFPESNDYDRSNWWGRSDSGEISALWRENLARAVYGDRYGAMARKFIGPVFTDHCGSRMR